MLGNPVVTGRAPLRDVWRRDYWGTPLASSESHKSWRPATTLTFRFDYRRTTTAFLLPIRSTGGGRRGVRVPERGPPIDKHQLHWQPSRSRHFNLH